MSRSTERAKYTPGPWRVDVNRNGAVQIGREDSLAIAEIWLRGEAKLEQANARLMAAAPELLESLEECAAVLCGAEMSKSALTDALTKARSAMKKARGE